MFKLTGKTTIIIATLSFVTNLYATSIPHRCPDLDVIKSVGLNGARFYYDEHRGSKFYHGTVASYYGSPFLWTLVIGYVIEGKMTDAMTKLKAEMANLMLADTFQYPYRYGSKWICQYTSQVRDINATISTPDWSN